MSAWAWLAVVQVMGMCWLCALAAGHLTGWWLGRVRAPARVRVPCIVVGAATCGLLSFWLSGWWLARYAR